jgi:hypothetical protein
VAKTFFLPDFACPPATAGSPGNFEPGRRAELEENEASDNTFILPKKQHFLNEELPGVPSHKPCEINGL